MYAIAAFYQQKFTHYQEIGHSGDRKSALFLMKGVQLAQFMRDLWLQLKKIVPNLEEAPTCSFHTPDVYNSMSSDESDVEESENSGDESADELT